MWQIGRLLSEDLVTQGPFWVHALQLMPQYLETDGMYVAQVLHGAHAKDCEVTSLAFSKDDNTLLSRAADDTLKVSKAHLACLHAFLAGLSALLGTSCRSAHQKPVQAPRYLANSLAAVQMKYAEIVRGVKSIIMPQVNKHAGIHEKWPCCRCGTCASSRRRCMCGRTSRPCTPRRRSCSARTSA